MKRLILLFALMAFVACKNQKSEAEEVENESQEMVDEEKPAAGSMAETTDRQATQESYAPQSSDDQNAASIKNALVNDLLKDDLASMEEKDRKFQYFTVDLNDDGKKEHFVAFMSPYFCGSGGCTVMLLDHEASVITKFTVMRTPIWAEKTTTNGWRNLLVRSGGELKELKFDGSTYPSNPSVVPTASFDAPSASAIIMFDDNFAKAKTYTF
jgi:hypothetical protein